LYDYLEGRLERRGPARIVVDVGGIGYDLSVPVGLDFGPAGRPRRVFAHLVVREDAHLLYGFPDADTRAWFRALLDVRGVGPALALGILSGLSTDRLFRALTENDPAPLMALRGVGRKTAEQILLDLRGKAPQLAAATALLPAAAGERTSAMLDAVQALVSIGYREKEALQSVENAAKEVGREDLEALVRTALSG